MVELIEAIKQIENEFPVHMLNVRVESVDDSQVIAILVTISAVEQLSLLSRYVLKSMVKLALFKHGYLLRSMVFHTHFIVISAEYCGKNGAFNGKSA